MVTWANNIWEVKYILQIWHFNLCGQVVRISAVKKHDELCLPHIQQFLSMERFLPNPIN